MTLPILVTLGDPNGLGPELALRYFCGPQPRPTCDCPVVLVGSSKALEAHVRLGQGLSAAMLDRIQPVHAQQLLAGLEQGVYLLTPPGVADIPVTPGTATPKGGLAAGLSLECACAVLGRGEAAALVTAPLHKAMLNAAGFRFMGHTEFLANRAGVPEDAVCMHLRGPRLAVSLVTTHPPLRAVPGLITEQRVERCLRQTCEFSARLGQTAPVAVCGLNPHAGEGGTIGNEEREIIAPAVERVAADGFNVTGPLPADTVFHRAVAGEFSAVLAMYHDQGLGPLKLLHFGEAVNVTLGLPYVRCSPDHGTGFDLVGTGRARMDSFCAAMQLAGALTAATGKAIAGLPL